MKTMNLVAAVVLVAVPVSVGQADTFVASSDQNSEISSSYEYAKLYDTSNVDVIDGGVVEDAWLLDHSNLNLQGGLIQRLFAYNNSNAHIFGGTITVGLEGWQGTNLSIHGGNLLDVNANDFTTVDVYGGQIERISAREFSVINLHAGEIQKLEPLHLSRTILHTSELRLTGQLYPDENRILGNNGTVTGKWKNGTPFEMEVSRGGSDKRATIWATGTIIPEPSSVVLAVILILGAVVRFIKLRGISVSGWFGGTPA